MRPNLPFLLAASNAILKPGGLLRWKKQLVKNARLSLPLTEVMKITRLICASRRASSVIAKAKAEAWQSICSSLSLKFNPKSVDSLLRPVASSPSSSSSSANFPNCSSPRESSASVYAAYLRSHFSVSQPKTLRSRARGYLSELCQASCPEESHSSFCSPLSPTEFLAAASSLSSSTVTGPDKVAYPMLKAPSSLWHGFSSSHLQSLLVFTFLSFHLEDIFHYFHTQNGKASRLSCFLPAYLSHLLRIKAF